MGYHTDFSGSFQLSKPLTVAQKAYLEKFCETRRMKRDAVITAKRPDPIREAVGLPVGTDGEFFVGAGGDFGQEEMLGDDQGKSRLGILNYNSPPTGQPGLWCQWVPNTAGSEIEWNGAEKFYSYVEWLKYIVEKFLKPWGLVLNGEVAWTGEESGDLGKIVVEDNKVLTRRGRVTYGPRSAHEDEG